MKFFVTLLCWTFVAFGVTQASEKITMTHKERGHILTRAQVWHPVNISAMNLREGPADPDLRDDTTLDCTYVDMTLHPLGGTTPKFECRDNAGRTYKIKYGKKNGEIYGSVASSRLLWALGFGADHVIPVQVHCQGCSKDPWSAKTPEPKHNQLFKYAAVIVKPQATVIYSGDNPREGVSWHELSEISEAAGGAPQEQIDAFKLMASIIAHVDNHAENQNLICLGAVTPAEVKECRNPLVYIHDVGATFSAPKGVSYSKFDLTKYRETPTWHDYDHCVAGLKHGGIKAHIVAHPRVGEAGRKFLANLLEQLSHQQIVDAFTEANVQNLESTYTAEKWAEAFEEKIHDVTDHPACIEN